MIENYHYLSPVTGAKSSLAVTDIISFILRVLEQAEIQNQAVIGTLPAKVLVISAIRVSKYHKG